MALLSISAKGVAVAVGIRSALANTRVFANTNIRLQYRSAPIIQPAGLRRTLTTSIANRFKVKAIVVNANLIKSLAVSRVYADTSVRLTPAGKQILQTTPTFFWS